MRAVRAKKKKKKKRTRKKKKRQRTNGGEEKERDGQRRKEEERRDQPSQVNANELLHWQITRGSHPGVRFFVRELMNRGHVRRPLERSAPIETFATESCGKAVSSGTDRTAMSRSTG